MFGAYSGATAGAHGGIEFNPWIFIGLERYCMYDRLVTMYNALRGLNRAESLANNLNVLDNCFVTMFYQMYKLGQHSRKLGIL